MEVIRFVRQCGWYIYSLSTKMGGHFGKYNSFLSSQPTWGNTSCYCNRKKKRAYNYPFLVEVCNDEAKHIADETFTMYYAKQA